MKNENAADQVAPLTGDQVLAVGAATTIVTALALGAGVLLGLMYADLVRGTAADYRLQEREAALVAATAQRLGGLAHGTPASAIWTPEGRE